MRRCEADQERTRQKRAATRGAYRVANRERMAARRALEWIGTYKARLVFRYEISDLFNLDLLPQMLVRADSFLVSFWSRRVSIPKFCMHLIIFSVCFAWLTHHLNLLSMCV